MCDCSALCLIEFLKSSTTRTTNLIHGNETDSSTWHSDVTVHFFGRSFSAFMIVFSCFFSLRLLLLFNDVPKEAQYYNPSYGLSDMRLNCAAPWVHYINSNKADNQSDVSIVCRTDRDMGIAFASKITHFNDMTIANGIEFNFNKNWETESEEN